MIDEEILGVFPGWIKESSKFLVKGWTCKLVFTTTRLIVSDMKKRIGHPMFVGDPDYVFQLASTRDRLKMKQVSAENILNASAKNYQIPYSEIAAIEMRSNLGLSHKDMLVFLTDNLDIPKYKLGIMIRPRHDGIFKQFLREVLPDKV